MMRSVGTLTRADLAEVINRKMGFSRAESLAMVEAILSHMSEALVRGENVKISGFGPSCCATRSSGSVAIRRPGSKCRSPRAVC